MDRLMIENGFLYNQSKNHKVTINSKSTKLGLSPRMWINFQDLYQKESDQFIADSGPTYWTDLQMDLLDWFTGIIYWTDLLV